MLVQKGIVAEKISTGYIARKFQALLHKSLKRFNVLVCHRRFGKTVFSINHAIDRGLRCNRRLPQIAYIAPTYGQAKRVAWDMLKEFTKNIPGVTINEADLRIEIQRPSMGDFVRFILLGAENPGTLKGLYLDGVILDEFAECDPMVWKEVVRPALSDRLGWAIFIGTPKGQNHFKDIYDLAMRNTDRDWFAAIYRASETGVLPKTELDQMRVEMDEAEYMQEMECSFTSALQGSYYGKVLEDLEKAGRVGSVPYDPALRVDTCWDLGIGDTTAIWFIQTLGVDFHVIDYFEQSGEGLDYYVKKLQSLRYVYRDHFFPHDTAARDLSSGKSREQTLRELGIRPFILPRSDIADGINAVRLMLPKCRFDRVKCERGLKSLSNYQRKWDKKGMVWNDRPLHNWASHGADALRTGALGMKSEQQRTNVSKLSFDVSDKNYDIFGG